MVKAASLEIHLFGEFVVLRGGVPIGSGEWGRQTTRSLLKLLLTRPGRVFSRDEIVEALWPDTSPEAAERSLRVTVSLLRRTLEPDLGRGSDSRYILRRRPGYTFDRDVGCEVDAWQFEDRRVKAEAAWKAERFDRAIEEYQEALDLVRGEFLAEDPYEEWAMEARGVFQERRLSVFSRLSECLALRGRYTEAVRVCNLALALDAFSEDLHRRLMLYHYCAGEQALALQEYRLFARTLKEELNTVPSPELIRLKEQMVARDIPGVDELRRYPRPRRPLRLPYSLSRTHFAGRDREYAMLAERLRETMDGAGSKVVAVEGEAGVGKTRLAEEFVGYARSQGVRVLSGRCYERELGPPLEPVTEALGPVVDVDEVISGASERLGEEVGYAWTAKAYNVTRIYHTLTRELVRASRNDGHKALILFVDDVQWADPATLDFLSYLARRISGERILLVFSYRREQVSVLSGWLEGLAERRMATTLSLDRLSPDDLTQILARMSSRRFGELSLLADFLHRESEGNPFYAVEYLRWLIESGAVRIDSHRRISELESEALENRSLPTSVRALIRARFGSLDEEARGLLELAAVIGRSVDLKVLSKATDRENTEVLGIIEPLMSSGLIVRMKGEKAYYFSHDKLRQTLYEDMGETRRSALHLRVAEVLERDGSEPAELAHHYLQAEAWRPALENLVLSARKAEENYAWQTTLKSYARALDVVEKLPDSDNERFELLVARDRFLEHMDYREERARAAEEILELARRLGDKARIAEAYIRRIGVLMALADSEGATEAGREAVAIFRELGDEAGEARAHRELGYARSMSLDNAGALDANLQALSIHRELGNRRAEAGDAGNIAHVYRTMGDHDSAIRWNQEALRIDRELGDEMGENLRLNSMASIQRERGDLGAALSLNLESLAIITKLGTKYLRAKVHINCGNLCLSLGDPDEALKHYLAAARLSRQTEYTRDEGYSLMGAGIALEQRGDPAGAAESYRRATELLQTVYEESGAPEELFGKAEALTLLGAVLHHSLDKPVEAMNAYEEAAGIYRRLADSPKLRKLLMNLAGLRWRTGDPEGSAHHYEEALDIAREHGEAAHEAAALASLSVVHRELGRLKESLRCGREALELLRDVEDLQAEAYVLSSLAESHLGLGHHPSALSCLKRSLRLRRKVGDKVGEVGVLYDLAKVHEDLGDKDHARKAREEAASKEGTSGEAREAISTLKRRN
jgi:predicted ATPase/DNA-binding SARP family transcriptional activator